MKKFFDNVFKPYIFPILLLFIGVLIKESLDLTVINNFFKNSSFTFFKFLNTQLSLWIVILMYIAILFLTKVINSKFKRVSKSERLKRKAIKNSPSFIDFHDNDHKIIGRVHFSAKVSRNDYNITIDKCYCKECTGDFLRMKKDYMGEYECICNNTLDHNKLNNIKAVIVTKLEQSETIIKK